MQVCNLSAHGNSGLPTAPVVSPHSCPGSVCTGKDRGGAEPRLLPCWCAVLLQVSLAECNFYGALNVVRKALQNGDGGCRTGCHLAAGSVPFALPFQSSMSTLILHASCPAFHGMHLAVGPHLPFLPIYFLCSAFSPELELPMDDLENAWLAATKQMAMALPPDHVMFEIALRELGRWAVGTCGGASVWFWTATVLPMCCSATCCCSI